MRTPDSAIFCDSGDGVSGETSGPPYDIAGTWDHPQGSKRRKLSEKENCYLACGVDLRSIPLWLVFEVNFIAFVR